jgi:spore maturation protein CgeB
MNTSTKDGGYRHPVSFVGALEYKKIQYLLQNISRLWPAMPAGMAEVLDRTVPAYRNDFLRDTDKVLQDCARDLGVRFTFPNGIVRQMVLSYIDREAGFRQRHEVIESLKPFGVRVFGEPFWEKAVGKAYYKGRINYYSSEIASLYRLSKVNLNISKYQLKTTVNQRVFDCPLCDGFLITDFRDDLEEYLRIDKDIAVYRDTEDLRRKIGAYRKTGKRLSWIDTPILTVSQRWFLSSRVSNKHPVLREPVRRLQVNQPPAISRPSWTESGWMSRISKIR